MKKQTPQGVKNNGCSHSVWAARQTNVSDEAVTLKSTTTLLKKQAPQGVKNNGCSHSVWAARQTNVSDEAVTLKKHDNTFKKTGSARSKE